MLIEVHHSRPNNRRASRRLLRRLPPRLLYGRARKKRWSVMQNLTPEQLMDAMSPGQKAALLVAAKESRAPRGENKARCDEVMAKIEDSIEYIKKNHEEQHRELYMLGLFVADFKDAAPFIADEHNSFTRWLLDHEKEIGLKKQMRKSATPSPAGSRAASMAPDEPSIDEDSMDEDSEGST